MRIFLILWFSIVQNTFAMGDPNFLPANPSPEQVPDLKDLKDTTLRINQFEQEEEDQQSQEENNKKQHKQPGPKPKRQPDERNNP